MAGEVDDRGLDIVVTELGCLDDGLPAAPAVRDRAVAHAYERYLEVALEEWAVKSVLTFGLSDRYSWLREDSPRADGAPGRPLPFDRMLGRKPAYAALRTELRRAPCRTSPWEETRASAAVVGRRRG